MTSDIVQLELSTGKTVNLTVTRDEDTIVLSSNDQSWKYILVLAQPVQGQTEIKTSNLGASWANNFPGLDELETKLLSDEISKKPREFWEK